MSTATLPTLTDKSKTLVSAIVGKLNNRKDWVLGEIVSVYQADPAITPQHLLVDVKGKMNVGAIFAAWYAHKSGIASASLNISLIADNYASIRVASSPEEMAKELARVADEARNAKRAANQADNASGKHFTNGLNTIKDALDSISKTIMTPSVDNTALLMQLQSRLGALVASYNEVSKATAGEPLAKVG